MIGEDTVAIVKQVFIPVLRSNCLQCYPHGHLRFDRRGTRTVGRRLRAASGDLSRCAFDGRVVVLSGPKSVSDGGGGDAGGLVPLGGGSGGNLV